MKQERMKILELLDQGKITATEAANLLEALRMSDAREPFWDEESTKRVQEKINKFTKNVEGISKDVGDKLESFYKEVEPKLRTATKVVVEKTATIVDEISKSLNETLKNFDECCDEAEHGECCCDETQEKPADDTPVEN